MTTRTTLLTLAAFAAGMCAEGIATAAKKRVVVLDVEGARNKKLENSLAELVGEEAKVLPSADYRKAAKKLKATKLSPDHVAKVAAAIEADGVLESLIIAEDGRYVLRLPDALGAGHSSEVADDEVSAPMPGIVKLIRVRPGDSVEKGQALAVMEAMKMELTLSASRAGVVESVLVGEGEQVSAGAVLVMLQQENAA